MLLCYDLVHFRSFNKCPLHKQFSTFEPRKNLGLFSLSDHCQRYPKQNIHVVRQRQNLGKLIGLRSPCSPEYGKFDHFKLLFV